MITALIVGATLFLIGAGCGYHLGYGDAEFDAASERDARILGWMRGKVGQ